MFFFSKWYHGITRLNFSEMTKWLKLKICCIIKVENRYSYLFQMIWHPIMCAIIMCSFRYNNSWWNYWFHMFSTFLYGSLQNMYIRSLFLLWWEVIVQYHAMYSNFIGISIFSCKYCVLLFSSNYYKIWVRSYLF